VAASRGTSALAKLGLPAKIGIAAILLVLGGLVYWVVFFGDLSTSIRAEQTREQQLHQELATARKAEHAYQKDLAELADRQQRERELNKVLPATTEYPAFLSAIQSVANVTGVSLTAWTPQDEVPEEFYARVPMKLAIQGRYHRIAKFFYNVGQLDRIINMENIKITDPSASGDDIVLSVEALATAFHSLESKGRVAAARPKGKP
jgi:type IV pilus assembly protein PilO